MPPVYMQNQNFQWDRLLSILPSDHFQMDHVHYVREKKINGKKKKSGEEHNYSPSSL